MAASTSVLSGIDFILRAGGGEASPAIGGGTSATLTYEQAMIETTNKTGANWSANLAGVRSWSVDYDSIWLESSVPIDGGDLSVTVGGTAFKGITSSTLALNLATQDIVNTTTGLDRSVLPTIRSATIDVQMDYYDPAGSGADALSDVLDELEGSTSSGLALVYTVSSVSVAFTGRPTSAPIVTPHDDRVTVSVSFESTGAVTDSTTGEDTGLGELLDAFFASGAATSLVVGLTTGVTDNSEWTGTAFPSSITIASEFQGRVDVSGSLIGSGAISRQAST